MTPKVEVEPPALVVMLAGDSVMPKSCSECTDKARLPECVSPADVPLAVTVKLPAGISGMERARVWLLPAVTLNGEVGEVVTPAGNPETVTVTGSLNPFRPVIDTVTVELGFPASVVIVEGDSAMLKSLAAGGEVGVDPPPQLRRLPMHSQIHTVKNARDGATDRQYASISNFPNQGKAASAWPED